MRSAEYRVIIEYDETQTTATAIEMAIEGLLAIDPYPILSSTVELTSNIPDDETI